MKIAATGLILALALSSLSYIALADDSACDYEVNILANGTDFEQNSFEWKMIAVKIQGKPTNITGTAEIMDMKGNIIKKYKPWTSEPISKQKTSSKHSPNLKDGDYKIISKIDLECNDINKNNNIDEKIIKIKSRQNGPQIARHENSTLQQPLPKESENNSISNKNNQTIDFENEIYLKDSNKVVKDKIIYESSNEKAKNLVLFFMLGISILLNIVLIWKR